jgi:hypothetical protein
VEIVNGTARLPRVMRFVALGAQQQFNGFLYFLPTAHVSAWMMRPGLVFLEVVIVVVLLVVFAVDFWVVQVTFEATNACCTATSVYPSCNALFFDPVTGV